MRRPSASRSRWLAALTLLPGCCLSSGSGSVPSRSPARSSSPTRRPREDVRGPLGRGGDQGAGRDRPRRPRRHRHHGHPHQGPRAIPLPDNGSAEAGSPQRVTYDLIATEFGPGYNSPLLVTANIITSTDPEGTVSSLATDIAAIPGVLAVTKQTPNTTADLGLVRIVPVGAERPAHRRPRPAPSRAGGDLGAAAEGHRHFSSPARPPSPSTSSDQLSAALVPFGIVVVGLSLILLTIVFRSIAVPIKATLGYLLSIAGGAGCRRRRVHVGLAGRAVVHRLPRTPGQLLPHHPHGCPVRAGDGLRGLPGLPDARGLRPTGNAKRAIRTGFIGSAGWSPPPRSS